MTPNIFFLLKNYKLWEPLNRGVDPESERAAVKLFFDYVVFGNLFFGDICAGDIFSTGEA